MAIRPPVVIDNGTGYTKMGYAGNYEPNYLVPSIISCTQRSEDAKSSDLTQPPPDLDFYIGKDAEIKRANYDLSYPIADGIISSWDNMEKYWQRCIYQYMSCDPEDHYFLLTEPPLNPPENREFTAEIFFETFNVPGLYIAVQAVLALCASLLTKNETGQRQAITGTVIDSGDGVTHVIPVFEGYVIGSCVKHIALAGRKVTDFIVQMLRDRGEQFPPDMALEIAKKIKEAYCYVCPDLVKEYQKFDTDASKFRQLVMKNPVNNQEFKVDVGYERFLAPEVFFSPEIFGSGDFSEPLPNLVDKTVQMCPIDTRKPLYNYITLSGGSTMFKHFTKRLERDVRRLVKERYDMIQAQYPDRKINAPQANVITHAFQRFAVWFGGSMLASQPEFLGYFHTRQQYQEVGPRIARHNPVFQQVT